MQTFDRYHCTAFQLSYESGRSCMWYCDRCPVMVCDLILSRLLKGHPPSSVGVGWYLLGLTMPDGLAARGHYVRWFLNYTEIMRDEKEPFDIVRFASSVRERMVSFRPGRKKCSQRSEKGLIAPPLQRRRGRQPISQLGVSKAPTAIHHASLAAGPAAGTVNRCERRSTCQRVFACRSA